MTKAFDFQSFFSGSPFSPSELLIIPNRGQTAVQCFPWFPNSELGVDTTGRIFWKKETVALNSSNSCDMKTR